MGEGPGERGDGRAGADHFPPLPNPSPTRGEGLKDHPRIRGPWRGLVALALALAVAGCTVGPDYVRPALDLPADGAAVPKLADDWWRQFRDPELDRLEAEALAHNLDLAEAVARIDEARASLRNFWNGVLDEARTSPLQRTPIEAMLGGWGLDASPACVPARFR